MFGRDQARRLSTARFLDAVRDNHRGNNPSSGWASSREAYLLDVRSLWLREVGDRANNGGGVCEQTETRSKLLLLPGSRQQEYHERVRWHARSPDSHERPGSKEVHRAGDRTGSACGASVPLPGLSNPLPRIHAIDPMHVGKKAPSQRPLFNRRRWHGRVRGQASDLLFH